MFLEQGIPVLRIGLQPTEDLIGGEAVAGASHPALGELVKSRVYRNRAEPLLAPLSGSAKAVLGVAPNRISLMTGQRRCNLQYLQRRFSIATVRVVPVPAEDWEIILQSHGEVAKML